VGEATAKARTEAVAGTQDRRRSRRPPVRTSPSRGHVTRSCRSRTSGEYCRALVRSKATSAHTLAVIEADYEGIERVRRATQDGFREEEGIGLSYLAFIARALTDTCATSRI